MIQIISGVYGTKHKMIRAGDPPFCLSEAEEARLVKRGVAKYVYEHMQGSGENGAFLPQYDVGMTDKQLRGIAAYYKVDVSDAKKKQDVVDALDRYFVSLEDESSADEEFSESKDEEPSDNDDEQPDPDAPKLGADFPTA